MYLLSFFKSIILFLFLTLKNEIIIILIETLIQYFEEKKTI